MFAGDNEAQTAKTILCFHFYSMRSDKQTSRHGSGTCHIVCPVIIAHCSSHWASFSLSLANLFADTICLALHLPAFLPSTRVAVSCSPARLTLFLSFFSTGRQSRRLLRHCQSSPLVATGKM